MSSNASDHPVERGDRGRGRFDRFSEWVSNVSSSAWFFVFCVGLIALWGGSYAFHASDSLRHVSAEAMTAVTLVLVALLKNADRRAEAAVQLKLDAIARALLARERGEDPEKHLKKAIGLHDEL